MSSQASQHPSTPGKKATVKKPTPVASHPTYREMILEAIKKLAQRKGSSRQAIVKYVVASYTIEEKAANQHTKVALKAGVQQGWLKQAKGVGASGSFRVGEAAKSPVPKRVVKKKAATAPKPTKAAKPKTPKKKASANLLDPKIAAATHARANRMVARK
jgi:histone H1/5